MIKRRFDYLRLLQVTKIRKKNRFKIQPQSRVITCRFFIIIEITSLSFKIRTDIGVCPLVKSHTIFQYFWLEMSGFVHRFMTGSFIPKLPRGLLL